MPYRRSYARRMVARRRPRWEFIRHLVQPTLNATLINFDLLQAFRTNAGISINLPEFTVWRIRLQISIKVTIAAAMAANDAVLATVFVDSQMQSPLNRVSNPWDQRDMVFFPLFLSKYATQANQGTAAGTYMMYQELDLKSHRKLHPLNDTVWLQLASSGQVQMTDVSIAHIDLVKMA